MTNKAGLKLTREVSLKVDWTNFGEKLVSSVIEGFKAFHGDFKSGVDAVFSLIGVAKSIKQDVPVGTRALELILLCFAWSFDAVRATDHLDEKAAKKAAKDAIKLLKDQLESGEMEIPFDFFEQPASAAPYQVMRDAFLSNRHAYRPSASEDETVLKFRFDSAFKSAVWEVWADNDAIFQDLARVLESPAAKTADFEKQWHAYRESLIREFHVAPVFGQEESSVSLGQLYVPLRCFWRETEGSDEQKSRFEERSDREQIHHIRLLEAELTAWLDNDDPDDWLRLIGGGPGSGKSTSARAFAAKIAERDDLRPIFIPLQSQMAEGQLRETINRYFRDRSGCPFRDGPLERKNVEDGPRLVLIFDGLDELARPGKSADELARDMMGWISDLHTQLRGDTRVCHRVLVTGRMPSFQTARRQIGRKGKVALEVLGFLPVSPKSDPHTVQPVEVTANFQGNKKLIEADDRKKWWVRYSSALGRPAKAPKGLTDDKLSSLTAEPLLCYLLALSGYLEGNAEEAADNRNKVYRRLLTDVWKRGWGGGPGKGLPQKDFDRLLETVALAAWHGGDERIATDERFEKALEVTDATAIYEDFKRQGGGDTSNLAINFYLKRPETTARGFEFTHKSFGEYLAARALLDAVSTVSEFPRRFMASAIDHWLDAVADGNLTDELLTFLRDEARLMPLDKALPMLRSLEKTMGEIISQGLPAHKLGCQTWRHAEERQRKAETMLMVLMHCISMRIAIDDKQNARIKIDWRDDPMAFGNLVHRIRKSRNSDIPALEIFSYMVAPRAWLFGQDLINSNFLAADLEHAFLQHGLVQRATFKDANLSNAVFINANLSDAILKGANLEDAYLNNANLWRANLKDAVLRGANLENANLENANLENANLENANLENANLENANFKGANLEAAKLQGTNRKGANFEGTILAAKETGKKAKRARETVAPTKKKR